MRVQFNGLLAFVVGGLGFEFCVFVVGWRHALRSEWPFIIIITIYKIIGGCSHLPGHWAAVVTRYSG